MKQNTCGHDNWDRLIIRFFYIDSEFEIITAIDIVLIVSIFHLNAVTHTDWKGDLELRRVGYHAGNGHRLIGCYAVYRINPVDQHENYIIGLYDQIGLII